ncbi:MAG: metal-dependent hydrolase [Actinomycetota bacterium]
MTDLTVRRLRFDFSDPVPLVWHPERPAFSHATNMASFIAICFETMIVHAVKEAETWLTDDEVVAEAHAFLRQEAQHANAHRQHVTALVRQWPGLQEVLDAMMASYTAMTRSAPLDYRLAYIADLEATFTPSFRFLLDNEHLMFAPGDDRVASLFLWHMVEEVEHRSSALTIYHAVTGRRVRRLGVLPGVVKHIVATLVPAYVDGVNAAVPLRDRVIDLREMSASWRTRQWLAEAILRRRSGHRRVPMTAGIDRVDKRRALRGLLGSQSPFFDPSDEPLPAFATRWFERYERGGDVTHWYGSAASRG